MFFMRHNTVFISTRPVRLPPRTHTPPARNPHGTHMEPTWLIPPKRRKQPGGKTMKPHQIRVLGEKKPNGEIDHVVMEAHHRYHLIIIPRRWT